MRQVLMTQKASVTQRPTNPAATSRSFDLSRATPSHIAQSKATDIYSLGRVIKKANQTVIHSEEVVTFTKEVYNELLQLQSPQH